MNNGQTIFSYSNFWVNDILDSQPFMFGTGTVSIDELMGELEFKDKLNINEGDLVGMFTTNEKKRIFHPIHFHYRHFFKSLCKFQL